jgi:hypothetical protein
MMFSSSPRMEWNRKGDVSTENPEIISCTPHGNRFRFNASLYDLKVTSQLHEVARLCREGHTKVWVTGRRSAHAVRNSLHGNYNSRETGNIEIQVTIHPTQKI